MDGNATAPAIDRRRLNFNLSVRAFEELKRLSDQSGLSMTEIMRVALGLVRIVMDEEMKGNRLMIMDSNERPLKEIVIPR